MDFLHNSTLGGGSKDSCLEIKKDQVKKITQEQGALKGFEALDALKDLEHAISISNLKTPINTKNISFISFEEGDQGLLHDPSTANSIPATCFEISSALEVLSNPGNGGEKIDSKAKALSEILNKIYNTELGEKTVFFENKELPLKTIFDQKLLKEVSPKSDQIGRCLDLTKAAGWYEGEGLSWLINQLVKSSDPSDPENHINTLTKMRMISAFGTVVRELMVKKEDGANLLVELVSSLDAETIINRHDEVMTSLRHTEFDSSKTRARYERPPILNGVVYKSENLQDAAPLGLGFGEVYGPLSFKTESAYNEYLEAERSAGGRNGLTRDGQPIDDLTRPGNISEYGLKRLPHDFEESNLRDTLKQKGFSHGTGVNRWQAYGTYARNSIALGFPAAGSHSGGTVDILLALNVLNSNSLKGNKEEVLPLGILIASFMNYGGYHSFVETLPIAKALAADEKFEVNPKSSESPESLYVEFANNCSEYLDIETSNKIKENFNSYKKSFDIKRTSYALKISEKKEIFNTENRTLEIMGIINKNMPTKDFGSKKK